MAARRGQLRPSGAPCGSFATCDVGADLCVRPPTRTTEFGDHQIRVRYSLPRGVQSHFVNNEGLPVRHVLRLRDYNYCSPGAYFITLCTENRRCVFGAVYDVSVTLTPLGLIIHNTWVEACSFCAGVNTDAFVVMPNHLHAVVLLHDDTVDQAVPRAVSTGLPSLIRRFKTLSTTRATRKPVIRESLPPHGRLWQRSYYEHVVRDDNSLERIRDYIATNPLRWALDRENPEHAAPSTCPQTGAIEPWMV